MFVFDGQGDDEIVDFTDGEDLIDITGTSLAFQAAMAISTTVVADGATVTFTDGGGTISFTNTTGADITLTADDFIF